jgi:Tol biopolymer transport system component
MRRISILLIALPVLAGCSGEGNAAAGMAEGLGAHVMPEQRPTLRRVWSGVDANFYASTPSPDGRLVTEIDWETGDLAIRDLETGALRRVTDKGTWQQSSDYAEWSVFSPDGDRLAYSWFSHGRGYELRLIGVDGSDMRTLLPAHEDMSYVAAEHWSPDGRLVLVTVGRRDRTTQIGYVDVESGRYTVLKSTDWRQPRKALFSPDSRHIAFDFPPTEQSQSRDIFVIAVDGTRESTVVGTPAHERLLGWLPDGSGILFHRQDQSTRAVWKIAVRDGAAAGAAQLVEPDVLQIDPLGFSRDAYYYGVQPERRQVHTMPIDIANGRALAAPQPVMDPSDGASAYGTWSPDGRSFAFLTDAPGLRSSVLVIRTLGGSGQREIPVFLDQARRLQWTDAGVYMIGTDSKGRAGIFRVDLATGGLHATLTADDVGFSGGVGLYTASTDGSTVFYRQPLSGDELIARRARLVAYDVASGSLRELAEVRGGRTQSLSPDGQWLAYSDVEPGVGVVVKVMPADGGVARTIHRVQGDTHGNRWGLPWSADGRFVLLTELRDTAEGHVVWRVPVDGGAAEPIVVLGAEAGHDLRVSTDGRMLSFGAGPNRGEIWRMEGLTGTTTAAR